MNDDDFTALNAVLDELRALEIQEIASALLRSRRDLGHSEGVRVRCRCGSDWPLLQVPDDRATYPAYTWLDAISRRLISYCPDCGAATSLLTMRAVE